jgi:hypothetical protein
VRTGTEIETVRESAPTAGFVPESGGRLLFKPKVIITGASGGAIFFDEWRDYGDEFASADVRFEQKECEPSCAEGTVSYVRATVRVGPIVACGETAIYESIIVETAEDIRWHGERIDLEQLCREGQLP